jgi:hypothetical protein
MRQGLSLFFKFFCPKETDITGGLSLWAAKRGAMWRWVNGWVGDMKRWVGESYEEMGAMRRWVDRWVHSCQGRAQTNSPSVSSAHRALPMPSLFSSVTLFLRHWDKILRPLNLMPITIMRLFLLRIY